VASVDIQNSQTGFQNVQYFSRKAYSFMLNSSGIRYIANKKG